MNEIINKTKTEIEGLNQRFFLILENFVPTYIRYLQNPQDEEMIKEISHINSVNTQIESDGFTIKNMMESTIATDQDKINKLNDKIRVLKKENEYLKGEQRDLKIAANTSVGLFDNELDWYKKQIKIIIVMLVGIVIVSKIYYEFNLDRWEFIKASGIVIVIGIIFELLIMLIMYLYTKIKYGDSHKLK